jgi:hypothetical protein
VCRSWGQTEGFARACVRDRPRNVAGGAGVCRSLPPDRPIALLVHHEERWRVLGSARFRLKRSRGCGYPPNVARPFGRLSPCTRAWAHPWCRNAEAVSGSGLRGAPPNECRGRHNVPASPHAPRATMTAHTVEALFGRQSFNAVRLHTSRERSRRHAWAKPCPVARSYTLPRPLATSRERSRTNAWEKPCLAPRTCTLTHRSYVPRTITTARMGEALFGREDYTPTHRSQPPESDHEPAHGRSPVWRADPRRSYERTSRDAHLAWPPVWDGAS